MTLEGLARRYGRLRRWRPTSPAPEGRARARRGRAWATARSRRTRIAVVGVDRDSRRSTGLVGMIVGWFAPGAEADVRRQAAGFERWPGFMSNALATSCQSHGPVMIDDLKARGAAGSDRSWTVLSRLPEPHRAPSPRQDPRPSRQGPGCQGRMTPGRRRPRAHIRHVQSLGVSKRCRAVRAPRARPRAPAGPKTETLCARRHRWHPLQRGGFAKASFGTEALQRKRALKPRIGELNR